MHAHNSKHINFIIDLYLSFSPKFLHRLGDGCSYSSQTLGSSCLAVTPVTLEKSPSHIQLVFLFSVEAPSLLASHTATRQNDCTAISFKCCNTANIKTKILSLSISVSHCSVYGSTSSCSRLTSLSLDRGSLLTLLCDGP